MSQKIQTRTFKWISRISITLAVVIFATASMMLPGLYAQKNISTISDQPQADAVINADAQFHAQRVRRWEEGAIQYLHMERDVKIAVGTYGFRAKAAIVRIQREALADGSEVRHMWMYLDDAQPLMGRGPTSASAPRLLVTVSTTGKVDLTTDWMQEYDLSATDLVADAKKRFASHYDTISQVRNAVVTQKTDAQIANDKVVANGGPTIIMDNEQTLVEVQSPFSASNPKAPVYQPKIANKAVAPQVPSQTPDTAMSKQSQPTSTEVEPVVADMPVVAENKVTEPAVVIASESKSSEPSSERVNQILPPVGTVSLSFDQMVVDLGKEQPYAVVMGNVGVMYVDREGQLAMSLRADQAVIFLKKNQEHEQLFSTLDASSVIGVYLEDNVQVTDGAYTVRAPRAYYDTVQNKAVVLDAVMYTWSVRKQVPLYMRASKIMQLSQTQWQAHDALLTTSEFAEPHFSIAARTITLTQKTDKQGKPDYQFEAQTYGVKWGNAKLFGGSKLTGNAQAIPLRSITMSYSGNNGPLARSSWDTFMLLGRDKPQGVDSKTTIDYLGQHGPGMGIELDYDKINMVGNHEGYLLLHDDGDDEIGSRNDIEHEDDVRGFYHGQHRSFLDNGWELSLELGYVSDETFLEEFFLDESQTQKPYETSLYLKKQENQSAMTLLASYDINDFTVNTAQLQYQGYTVDKLPELGFYSIGESWFDNKVTYYGETRASRMRIRAGDDSPNDRGFTAVQSQLLFGQPATQSFYDAYSQDNVPSGYVLRLDSRHEVQAPMKAGTIDLVPYAVGRATGYDDDFNEYRGNDENIRLWGSVGLRAHTQFNKTVSDVDNRLFDIHQLKHIIEPSLDVSFSDTTVESSDLPVYDYDVERLREGLTIAVGLRNTFQTKRGGPGRWRTVDWLVIDSHYVHSSDEAEENPDVLAHYFGYRPEFTRGGEYFHTNVAWMISDSLASMSEFTYDFDQDKLTQWRTGLSLVHTPALTTFVDYQEIDTLDTRLLTYGFTYQLTSKYAMSFAHRLDFSTSGEDQRYIDVTLVRDLPRWKLATMYSYDETDGEHTVGIMLVPVGIGGSRYSKPIYDSALR